MTKFLLDVVQTEIVKLIKYIVKTLQNKAHIIKFAI